MCKVVNLRDAAFDVYIGRAGRGSDGYFGNPFSIGKDGNREQVIEKYRSYFYDRLKTDTEFVQRVEALRGKTLGCFCKPHACHGDVIVEYLQRTGKGDDK